MFHHANAVVVPSLFPETFGYVVLEAFAVKTPVIVHRGGGAIAETGEMSGGGIGYDTLEQLEQAIQTMVNDPVQRQQLADQGYQRRSVDWSESAHMRQYFEMIESAQMKKLQT